MTAERPDSPPPAPGTVVVPVPADAAARASLTTRVAALSEVRHTHIVAVHEVRATRPGVLDVVHVCGEAADLPTVLAVRGRLAPAEAAAVGIDVAQALAALHAAGLVHGPVEPQDVVLRADGAPALRPRAVPPPEEWTSAEDVRALARLVVGLLGSRPVTSATTAAFDGDRVVDPYGALRTALEPALAADPRGRPEAGTLAALLDGACEPATVRLPDPATLAGAALASTARAATAGRRGGGSGPSPASGAAHRLRDVRRPARRPRSAGPRDGRSQPRAATGSLRSAWRITPRTTPRGSRRKAGRLPRRLVLRPVLAVVAVGVAVGLMTGAGLELRGRDGANAQPHRAPAAPVQVGDGGPVHDRARPAEAAAELTQRRLDLLSRTEVDVAVVDIAGSPAHAADTALLARLDAAGTRPEKPQATVSNLTVVAHDDMTAQVRVEYVVEAHAQVSGDGTRTAVPASASHVSTLGLRWTVDGWRVEGVG